MDLKPEFMRTEKDFLGNVQIEEEAMYGINAVRARENFQNNSAFPVEWYKNIAKTKLAFYQTYLNFKKAVQKEAYEDKMAFSLIDDQIMEAMISVVKEMAAGKYFEWFIVPAIQGGAGTSINMNVNEIIANAALVSLGHQRGDYHIIDPFEHANIFQSTNDVIPTSLRIAIMELLEKLEKSINDLRFNMESLERNNRTKMRVGYTQMQEAVPSSYGILFSTYNEALSRDWWRVSKCFERIKQVNLGGGAIGTGISIPRYFIMEAVPMLQKITNLPVTRSENLADATNNLDGFVEIHAVMKSHAVNLEKMANDLRLLSSDIAGKKEMIIPRKQTGSSIMPGKVNPVIPEFIISGVHRIYANDALITSLSGQGCLELNAYIPVIGHAIIESLHLLHSIDESFNKNLIDGIVIDASRAVEKLSMSPSVATVLNPIIGYKKATLLANEMKNNQISITEANRRLELLDEDKLKEALKPENLLKLGFSVHDLT